MTDADFSQTEKYHPDRGPVSFDLLAEFPTHADALREIDRLQERVTYRDDVIASLIADVVLLTKRVAVLRGFKSS